MESRAEQTERRVPVTVLTGFLGSGKTTLLNRILTEQHGQRIAVIENEFGEIGIDQALVIGADEEIFEMNNGCICCTVRGDLIRILGQLMRRRDRFDRILVETTGMADPAPVAQTFFVDDEIREQLRLDGIVTMVDAKHCALHIDESDECKEQIAFADVLVINKTDLASEPEIAQIEARVRAMNPLAKLVRAKHGDVPIATVLEVGGFDLRAALDKRPTFLEPEYPFEWVGVFALEEGVVRLRTSGGLDPRMRVLLQEVHAEDAESLHATAEQAARRWAHPAAPVASGQRFAAGDLVELELLSTGEALFEARIPRRGQWALFTEHLPSEVSLQLLGASGEPRTPSTERTLVAAHTHDETVGSVGIRASGEVDPARFNEWISGVLRERGVDIFRSKGIVALAGSANRLVFQGVHMLLDAAADRPWGAQARVNELVFIGRNLDRAALEEGFRRCLR